MQKISFASLLLSFSFACLTFWQETFAYQEIADLSIDKTIFSSQVDEVSRGEDLVWKVVVLNRGPIAATNIIIEDHYVIQGQYSMLDFPDSCRDDGEKLQCSIPLLLPRKETTFVYSVKIKSDAPLGATSSDISVYSDQNDHDDRDNWSSFHYTILDDTNDEFSKNTIPSAGSFINDMEGELFSESDFSRPVEIDITDLSLDTLATSDDILVHSPEPTLVEVEFSQDEAEKIPRSGPKVWQLALLSLVFGFSLRILRNKKKDVQ